MILNKKNNINVIKKGELVKTSNWQMIPVKTIVNDDKNASINPVINQLNQNGILFNPIINRL